MKKTFIKITIIFCLTFCLNACVGTTIQQNVDYLEKKINLPNFKIYADKM